MNIIVYGLGIIGASLCASLKEAGHTVYGKNRSREPVRYALEHNMIDGEAKSFAGAEVVFLALPPRAVMRALEEEAFPAGCIVVDICGVKKPIEEAAYAKQRAFRYVGAHPMAGKETTGIASASAALFRRANLVLTKCAETDPSALDTVCRLADDMGFGRVVVCSAEEHDQMIALTSQLAHVVSNAYVQTPLAGSCGGYTGGSFQDMTRVAPVDENVWTELFFLNGSRLVGEITRLIDKLSAFREALSEGDEEEMRALLRAGKASYGEFSAKE